MIYLHHHLPTIIKLFQLIKHLLQAGVSVVVVVVAFEVESEETLD